MSNHINPHIATGSNPMGNMTTLWCGKLYYRQWPTHFEVRFDMFSASRMIEGQYKRIVEMLEAVGFDGANGKVADNFHSYFKSFTLETHARDFYARAQLGLMAIE